MLSESKEAVVLSGHAQTGRHPCAKLDFTAEEPSFCLLGQRLCPRPAVVRSKPWKGKIPRQPATVLDSPSPDSFGFIK